MTRPSVRDEVASQLNVQEQQGDIYGHEKMLLLLAQHVDILYAATEQLLRLSQLIVDHLGMQLNVSPAKQSGDSSSTST